VANEHGSNLVVVPLTSNTSKVYPFQLFLTKEQSGLDRDSKAQVELLRSVSRSRLGKKIGRLPKELRGELDARLKLHLGL
jgi:mRNA interferase MazF